jgi:5'-nucleotidase
VLLTNDDGIFAPGMEALRRAAADLGAVHVVAPAEQQSGASHSINLYRPVQVRAVRRDGEFIGHMVRGTPVDCVKLAVAELLDDRPDVLISGINDKANFGISVLYSGTVAAAVEGALLGIHSVAVSVAEDGDPDLDYAARLACDLAREAVAHPRPRPVLLNVNVPALPRDRIRGVKWIRHNVAPYTERFRTLGRRDDWDHYQIYGVTGPREQTPGDDVAALLDGYVTVTPLRVDFTDHDTLATRSGA